MGGCPSSGDGRDIGLSTGGADQEVRMERGGFENVLLTDCSWPLTATSLSHSLPEDQLVIDPQGMITISD